VLAIDSAISAAYLQLVSAAGLIFAHHALVEPIEASLIAPMPQLAAGWISGLGLGLALLRLRLRRPGLASLLAMGWMRVGMVTSGAMFLGHVLPAAFLDWVVWNPLFHAIDQARGLAFENYVPRHSLAWPVRIFAVLALLLGTAACQSGSCREVGRNLRAA
jgi:ABC-type polysaccharide/polyol phosphate export permease